MKTDYLHLFEFLQQIQDSPHDQTLRIKFDKHITECAECCENLALFHELQIAWRDKLNETIDNKLSTPKMVFNVKKRIKYKRIIPDLLRPLPGLTWIIITILMVLLLSWGITRIRSVSNGRPVAIVQSSTPINTPTAIYPSLKTCRTLVYTVEENDTLLAISAYFNVSVQDIWEENNLANIPALKPGMNLDIPFCGWSPDVSSNLPNGVSPIDNCPLVQYIIQKGETLEMLSIFFNVPVPTIIIDNQLENSSVLSPGDILAIPLCKNP
jgi:LysM repeat protein